MIEDEIKTALFKLQDHKYRLFQAKLIPNINIERVIGVRTPELRKIAREMVKREDIGDFLSELPHKYFDQNQLHAFIICEIKDYHKCVEALCAFLPYIDNWATCDQLSPKIFKKHKDELLVLIKAWLSSNDVYTVRFAIGMLMAYFLDENFDLSYPKMVSEIESNEYYINMMRAWYFATALAKQYDSIIPFIEEKKLDIKTHNKTIQKAVESRRIKTEQKAYLRSLRVSLIKNI